MSRKNPDTGEDDMKYARNARYMFPKTRQQNARKVNFQVRELVDLTEDAAEVVVKNLCDVIDLDATDYNLEVPEVVDSSLVTNFTKQCSNLFEKCPFCTKTIGSVLIASHFDNCRGYQEKVTFNLPMARGII